MTLVAHGEVKVNGAVERNPHCWVDMVRDRIEVSEKPLEQFPLRYCMANKPKGFVTTRAEERGARSVFELLDQQSDDMIAVGRLDKESTGLLLFTNDHRFADRVTSPESGLYKTYRVSLDRPIEQAHLKHLEEGMSIHVKGTEIVTRPALVRRLKDRDLEISIREGKNRQIRRMLDQLSYEVVELQRVAIGTVKLGNLPEGHVRDLTAEELEKLKEVVEIKRLSSAASGVERRPKRVLRGNRRIPNR